MPTPENIEQVETVTLRIDGKEISVPKGTLLLDACLEEGIDVPFFCYHKHMSSVGACRQCLVAVEGVPKPVTSCTTPVSEGMVVDASSEKVKQWREGIVGFLLANHPLECPTCDKGGECDLQNISFAHGPDHSLFREGKRHFTDYDMGPFVVRDMDRCIQCQRCIRFGHEWSGDREIDFFGRGSATTVNTFGKGTFFSKFSGNVTEVCPVGALTAEPYRLVARPWEVRAATSLCNHCAVGCNTIHTTRQNALLRITARENVHVNVCWTCDKGKFGIDFVDSEARLKTPLFRKNGQLVPASWQEALLTVVNRLRDIKEKFGPDSIGFLGSQKTSNEDIFMFQRLAREGIGTSNIDSRDGENFSAALIPGSGLPLDEIERARVIVLFMADVREEAPLVWLRVHHALQAGAKLVVIDEKASEADSFAVKTVRIKPGSEIATALSLVSGEASELMKDGFVLLAGPRVTRHYQGSDIVRALWSVADSVPNSRLGLLLPNNNTRGAYDMGAVPDHGPGWEPLRKPGMNTTEILQSAASGQLQALYIMGADPLAHYPDVSLVQRALSMVPFIVVQDILRSDWMECAHVILPGQTFAERDGTFTNTEGRIQYFKRSVDPIGSGRPDWEILAAVLQGLGVAPGVLGIDDVTRQIAEAVPEYENAIPERLPLDGVLQQDRRAEHIGVPTAVPQTGAEGSAGFPLILLTGDILYDRGPLTRDTKGFDELESAEWIDLSYHDADHIGVQDGQTVTVTSEFGSAVLKARVRDWVSEGTVFVPRKVGSFSVNVLCSFTRKTHRVRVTKA